jgi:D-glycero-D-manno-heptose 1,7-bisphosphate phosphatase
VSGTRKRSFVFLDRDGTLVEDRGYAWRVEDCVLLPGTLDALRSLRDAGFPLAIVTNQSGIGRGTFSRADFDAFQAHLLDLLERGGIEIEATFVCPHHPDDGCSCRKPRPGLLERARDELRADLASSWVVGDSPADMALAEAAGCSGIYVLTGHGAERRAALRADVPIVRDLREAAQRILAIAHAKAR